MYHELKISPKYYDAVLNGYKNFEVRRNDRGFQVGDTLLLKEYREDAIAQMSRPYIIAVVKYVLTAEEFPFGLKDGYCVLALTDVHIDFESERRKHESGTVLL